MSPSALSRMISRLEEEAGVQFFDRTRTEVKLTDNGAKFAEFARKSLVEQTELFKEFSKSEEEVGGVLHVYASVTACYSIMPPFIKKLSEKYAGIQLSIETGDPALAVQAVVEGRAEVAVTAIPENGIEGMDCIPVKTSPLVFAASNSRPFKNLQGSPQDIISSVPLVLPKTGLARLRFDSWTKSRNVHPKVAAEAEGNEAVMALAALGLGIALVPKIVLENGPYSAGWSFFDLGNAVGHYDIGFIQKMELSGTEQVRRMRLAVSEILHSSKW